jgi:hypothetical protein
MLDGSFIHNLELLSMPTVSEKQHYVANGYANLWVVDGKDSEYAVVFIPQLITEIGEFISEVSFIAFIGILIVWWIKKFY